MMGVLERLLAATRANVAALLLAAALVPLSLLLLEAGEYKANADESHRTAAELERVVDGLVHIEQRKADRAEAKAEAKAKAAERRRRELAKLCRARTLTDRDLCRAVGAPLP
jgi:hypothetical protein